MPTTPILPPSLRVGVLLPLACLLSTGQTPEGRAVPVFGTTVVRAIGFKGDIYHLPAETHRLPDFTKLAPVGSIYTSELNVPPQDFQAGFPGLTDRFEWFAIDYRGRFWITKPGEYSFQLTADDGARLYVDGKQVIDNDGIHPPRTRAAKLKLKAGPHRMRVSYYQGPRFEVALLLQVAGPGELLRVFSMDEFGPPLGLESAKD